MLEYVSLILYLTENNVFKKLLNNISKYSIKSLQITIGFVAWVILLSIIYAAFTGGVNYDSCIDSGFCEEGEEITTDCGRVTISKEVCNECGWEWKEKHKACQL